MRIIVIVLFLIVIVVLKYKSNEQELILDTFVNLPLFVITILISPIPNKYLILLFILYLFRINLMFYKLFYNVLSIKSLPNDKLVRYSVVNFLETTFQFKHNFHHLPLCPTIIVSNYCYDRLENIFCIVIPKDIAIVMGRLMITAGKLDRIVQNCIVIKKHQYQMIKEEIFRYNRKGVSSFAYITDCHHKSGLYTNPVRTGMFRIAKELNIPITPIAFDYIQSYYGIIPYQNYEIKVGDTFSVSDIEIDTRMVQKFFNSSLKSFRINKNLNNK